MAIIDEKDEHETIAIIRYWFPACEGFEWEPKYGSWGAPKHIEKRARKMGTGCLIALFPEDAADMSGSVGSFVRDGGYSAATYSGVMQTSVAATPEEEKEMKDYLESEWGYRIILRKKCTSKMDDKRRTEARKMREMS